ncbi:MAG: chemotaxis protein CheW [Pseudomonadota bacterium]|jgi:chemotaxis signal transduction protein
MTDTAAIDPGTQQAQDLPVHEVVVCAVGREYFALPLESLAEIYKVSEITPLPLSPPYFVGIINVHGNLASVLSLGRILGLDDASDEGLLLILTAEYGGIALHVDTTTGFTSYTTLEDVARDTPSGKNSVEIIEGVFRDEGKLVSLINPEKLRVWIDGEFMKGDD